MRDLPTKSVRNSGQDKNQDSINESTNTRGERGRRGKCKSEDNNNVSDHRLEKNPCILHGTTDHTTKECKILKYGDVPICSKSTIVIACGDYFRGIMVNLLGFGQFIRWETLKSIVDMQICSKKYPNAHKSNAFQEIVSQKYLCSLREVDCGGGVRQKNHYVPKCSQKKCILRNCITKVPVFTARG